MKGIFEEKISRLHTMSRKWDGLPQYFGTSDVLPFWVADMDFQAPIEVREEFQSYIEKGVFGYVMPPSSFYESIVNWLSKRHQWNISTESIIHSPGVLAGISMTLDAFTSSGDSIVIQTPVYPPFAFIIKSFGRNLLENPLIEKESGFYEMDLENLEEIFKKEKPAWFILCNPHNPVGRVWKEEELKKLADLCSKYGISVISDEIHGDLALGENKYIPFASVAEPLGVTVFTGSAASKSFNLAGLTTAFWIVSDVENRKKLQKSFARYEVKETNIFGIIGTQVCYEKCSYWLDELKQYLMYNAYYVNEMINYHAPGITANFPEGTYLSWLDCRGMNLSQEELKKFFIEEAKVALNDGTTFGKAGEGFMRLNFGCSREQLREGLERIIVAARSRKGWNQ